MISVTKLPNEDRKIATPYYCPDAGSIVGIHDLYNKVVKLREEIDVLEKKHKLWGTERHNLKYGIYFRGQPNYRDPLIPKVGRLEYRPDQERNVLHRFRRRSYFQYQRILTDWEALFLARHFGLPTRLLDWTSGQYVGLYWACEKDEDMEKDGAVWVLVRQPGEGYDLNVFNQPLMTKYSYAEQGRFLVKGVKLVYPFYVHPRMTAQASLFTIQDDPAKHLEEYDPNQYARKDFDIFHLRRWKVPKGKTKKKILGQLEDIGVNIQTLFPDLEGLVKGIEQTEEARSQRNKQKKDKHQ